MSQSEPRNYSRLQLYRRPPGTLQYGRLGSPVSMPRNSVQTILCTPGTLDRIIGYQPAHSKMPYEHPLVFQLVAEIDTLCVRHFCGGARMGTRETKEEYGKKRKW